MKKLHKSKLVVAIIACTASMTLYENSYAQHRYLSSGQFGRMGGGQDDVVTLTYTVPTCSGTACNWAGPKASSLKPYPKNRTQKLPITSCTGFGNNFANKKILNPLTCKKTEGGGFGTIVSSQFPYSWLQAQTIVAGISTEKIIKDGSDVSCVEKDKTSCGNAVLNEYNCKLDDGKINVDVLGDQGDPNSKNYVDGGKWNNVGNDSNIYATYKCLQTGTVNGDKVCITRQYPIITHGFYGAVPKKYDTNDWPNPDGVITEKSGKCQNQVWSEMDFNFPPTPTKAILQRQLDFFNYYTSNPHAEGNNNYGPMITLPHNKYKDENGNFLKEAVLSIGHGTMTDKCGDLTLASNGPRAILQMSVGTRSWSYEANAAAYLDFNSKITGMHQKLLTGVNTKCNSSGQGIQPWVQSVEWEDICSTLKGTNCSK